MRVRSLVRGLFPFLLLWVWVLVYLATGVLRVQVVEVLYPYSHASEDESLQVLVSFENAAPGGRLACRWTPPPPAEPMTETLKTGSADGELLFELAGFEVPAGYHRIVIADQSLVPLAERFFYIPPRQPQYLTRLEWEETGLAAAVHYRHSEPGARLAGEWSLDGRPIPEPGAASHASEKWEREVTLETSSGVVDFHLPHPADGPLADGCYEFVLFSEGMFVSRTAAPSRVQFQ
ncbi:MAG TPA: hypothetical protein ENN88_02325 [Candidatus Coatesbacteria bacterium]|nr:hypothetical protein [Candidatus Coatesbacteria bacterium]